MRMSLGVVWRDFDGGLIKPRARFSTETAEGSSEVKSLGRNRCVCAAVPINSEDQMTNRTGRGALAPGQASGGARGMETRTCGAGAISRGSSVGRIRTTSVQKSRSLAIRN